MKSKKVLVGTIAIVAIMVAGCGQPTQADVNKYFTSFESANAIFAQSSGKFINDMNDTSTLGIQNQTTDLSDLEKSLSNLKSISAPSISDIRDWNTKMIGAYQQFVSDANQEVKDTESGNAGAVPDMVAMMNDNKAIVSLLQQEPQVKQKYEK